MDFSILFLSHFKHNSTRNNLWAHSGELNQLTPIQIQIIMAEHCEHKVPCTKIAQFLGCSRQKINRIIKTYKSGSTYYGIKGRPPKISNSQQQQIKKIIF